MSISDYYTEGAVSDYYGAPRPGRIHTGTDFSHSTEPGTPVPALLLGVVTEILEPANWHGYGWTISVTSGRETFRYAHGDSAPVHKMGAGIKAGTIVLTEGLSGNTEGPCCHVEYFLDGERMDAWPRIQQIVAEQSTEQIREVRRMASVHYGGRGYGIDRGFITHYGTQDQALNTMVAYGEKEVVCKSLADFADILDGSGIPRQVLDDYGNVWNPETERFEFNGMWSWERAAYARLAGKRGLPNE